MKYEIRISEASTDSRQNIAKNFNKLHYCSIREWRLFKHHSSHRQVVKKCFTDSATKSRDWNDSLKFHKECLLTSWSTFDDCVRSRQSIYQWILGEILWDSQHSTLTIHCVSSPDWQIHWEDEQCHWIDVESFQQLGPDKLSSFTADDTISNKKLCCLCNRNLTVFLTSWLWAGHYSDGAEPD